MGKNFVNKPYECYYAWKLVKNLSYSGGYIMIPSWLVNKTIKITVDEDMSYYKKVFKSVLYMSKNLIGKKVLVEYGFV